MRRQALQLAVGLLLGIRRQVGVADLGPVFLDFRRALVLLSQFGPDGLELLAQVVLALLFVHVLLDLVLDLLAQLQDFDLFVDDARDLLQALGHAQGFQYLLLFLRRGVQRGGDHVRQSARLLDGLGHVDDFGRKRRGGLHHAREQVDEVGHQGFNFGVLRGLFGQMLDFGLEEGLAVSL